MTKRTSNTPWTWPTWLICLITFCFMTSGIIITFYPTIFSGFARLQANPEDGRVNNYILEHHWLWLNGILLHNSFWDLPFFYPTKNVLAYTDTLFSLAPFYWLWRAIGFVQQPDR